jgi:crotonobetainyl-CoA:carnitine CoA-transferase CaiB-like acyl-CoA transferase
VVQAASGFMAANADAAGRPQRVGFPVIDYAVGQQAAMAVMAALVRRGRHPGRARGEWLQVTMAGAALSLLAPVYAPPLISGITPPRSASTAFSGSPLSGTFEAADGHLAVVCNAADQAAGLLRALQEAGAGPAALEALLAAAKAGDVAASQAILAEQLRSRSTGDWQARLAAHGVPGTAVVEAGDAAKAAAHEWPQVSVPGKGGSRRVAVPGIGFTSSEPLTVGLCAPPRRGGDTRALLAEGGLDAATIDAMLADGAAWAPPAVAAGGN